jgi:hypothetical protein
VPLRVKRKRYQLGQRQWKHLGPGVGEQGGRRDGNHGIDAKERKEFVRNY